MRSIVFPAKWIWLDPVRHPEVQESFTTVFVPQKERYKYCVAEFAKEFFLEKSPVSAEILVSADTKYILYLDGKQVGRGPAAAGGDFGNTDPMTYYYADAIPVEIGKGAHRFTAKVQMTPEVQADYSCGHGGFILRCRMTYEDGTTEDLCSDESWQVRLVPAYAQLDLYDATRGEMPWEAAMEVADPVWDLKISPLPQMQEEFIPPVSYSIPEEYQNLVVIDGDTVRIKCGAPVTFFVRFDKIYAGYLSLCARGDRGVNVLIQPQELLGRMPYANYRLTLNGDLEFESIRMYSIGVYQITVSNMMVHDVVLEKIGLVSTCYPVTQEGNFRCDDEDLNRIYDLGKWTLRICRQSYHMDSPTHQEALGCTGDYYIESAINYFTYGDPRLTRLDIIRTADLLRMHDGKMFHTTYSSIFVQMVLDYYCFTGEKELLTEVIDALHILLERFYGYMGTTGLLEDAPDYMFVDWVPVEEFNMHHPPKALGQSVLNAFYYKALVDLAEICTILGEENFAETYAQRAAELRVAFRRELWDEEKQLFIDGRTEAQEATKWRPANVSRKYYSQHTNTLAVLYHLCEPNEEEHLLDEIVQNGDLIQAQPYFMHYVMDAIFIGGKFDQYGLSQIRRWKKLVEECDKGMKECWYGFDCDFSHAWGATPTYQLPARLLGFEMIEPGFRKIRLTPRLYGLRFAEISVPTPYGDLRVEMHEGQAPVITLPAEITAEIF